MRLRLMKTLVLAMGVLLSGASSRGQQSSPSPSQDAPSQTSSGSTSTSKPSAPEPPADDNSFPEDKSRKAAQEKKKPDASPSTPPADAAPKPGGDENAFPEDVSRKAAADAGKAGSTASNSGASSSSDYSDGAGGSGRDAVRPNVPLPHMNDKDPVKEDVEVGMLYLQTGNYLGAYQRFKEATTLAPENTDAMFGLAEAARHLKKHDEAMANYQLFLQIVPSGPKVKDARKAVASLEKSK